LSRSKIKDQPSTLDETTAWARAVVANEVVACELVKLACKRHLRDLELGAERGLVWRPDFAQYALAFFPKFCRHSKGEWARKPLTLGGWQKFSIGSVFGWHREDGTRRFRYVYEELPRKNGKSTTLAGVGLFMLDCDGEEGAEIYAAATKKDQARIIFDEAKRMVRTSPELSKHIVPLKLNLSVEATSSKFEPLSSDENTLDGLNPHCILIDELHKHKNRSLLDVMDTAVGSRRQPLIWIITTAGDESPESVYASENDYAVKVLQGVIEDDNVFAFIATMDKGDKWDDPKTWEKANPNFGVSVKQADLERQALKASKSPTALSAFMRLRLNVRSSHIESAIDMNVWAANGGKRRELETLKGRRCWGGLDLSSKIDISAFVLLFEPSDDTDGKYLLMPRFWMPADTLEDRAAKDRNANYRQWVDDGYIEVTPGNVVDHSEIERAVLAANKEFVISSIAFDPWNATQLSSSLTGAGVPMVEFIQGLRSYTEPTKEFLNYLLDRKFDHGNNPVLRWMASNLKTHMDKNLNRMPHKMHSTGRIDGITASIMALGRCIAIPEEAQKNQVIII
jgi:phage terminase large subunit-like protein